MATCPGGGASPVMATILFTGIAFWLLGPVSPARSQLEPEAYTILKAAVTKIPPDANGLLYAMRSSKTDADRQKLADVWLRVWKEDAVAFDTFDTCLIGGNKAKEAAPKLIKILGQTLSEKEVQLVGSALLDRLGALSATERQRLSEFSNLAKGRIKKK
jgi:hypothetical protein